MKLQTEYSTMISIFAVSKSEVYLKTMAKILANNGILLTGICSNPYDALATYQTLQPTPSVVLMDVRWLHFKSTSVELLTKFMSLTPQPPHVIVMTSVFEKTNIEALKERGARGYFCRSTARAKDVMRCIASVASGQLSFQSTP